jgi:hypothetical protein
MRYSLIPLTAVFAYALTACGDRPTALESADAPTLTAADAQGPPTAADPTPFTIEGFCEFAILAENPGKEKTIALPGGRTILIFPGFEITLTNLENGRRETFSNTGTFHLRTLENGDLEFVAVGRNVVGAPGAGLDLVIGRFIMNPATGLFEPAGGRMIDLCELLA